MMRVLSIAQDGRFTTEEWFSFDAARPPSLPQSDVAPRPEITWVDLESPTLDELNWLGKIYRFHPLAIEDCAHFDQRPKVEGYADHLFIVIHGLTDTGVVELHCFLARGLVVTVHDEKIPSLQTLAEKIRRDRTQMPRDEDALMHRIMDGVVDSLPKALDFYESRLEELDEDLLGKESHRVDFDSLLQFQRELNRCRHTLMPQRDVFRLLASGSLGQIKEQNRLYFRDILDHLERALIQLEEIRDGLWTARELAMTMASHRTNETVKRLTVFSVIFMPLTFITGFFGMNFEHIPWSDVRAFGATVFGMILIPVLMGIWFLKKRWM